MSNTVKKATKDEMKRVANILKTKLGVEYDTTKLYSLKECDDAIIGIVEEYIKAKYYHEEQKIESKIKLFTKKFCNIFKRV